MKGNFVVSNKYDFINLEKSPPLKGELTPPPDKSISHRAVLFSSIAEGKSVVERFLTAGDPLSTVEACRQLGVDIELLGKPSSQTGTLVINGKGHTGLREPEGVIDCGNSGTTMRLLAGLLSSCPFFTCLTGDGSLIKRPMKRVVEPLGLMGASIMGKKNGTLPPLAIRGATLNPINYTLPVASAQVKSALILGGLFAGGKSEITEPIKSRDHTERMLAFYGARLVVNGLTVTVEGGNNLKGEDIRIPGDFSSAAFIMTAALCVEGSEVIIKDVGLNPTRTGFLKTVKKMGGKVHVENVKTEGIEETGDIVCQYTDALNAIRLDSEDLPAVIDEFPILCVLLTRAQGRSEIRGARELRLKESDRIAVMAKGLETMGAKVWQYEDGIAIEGPVELGRPDSADSQVVESFDDHRIAMAFSVAALSAKGVTTILNPMCADISFPGFYETLGRLAGR